MERNRELRRVTAAAAAATTNGGGLSKRRQRNGSYRDSLDEDGMEVQEMGRLRDRGSKKDRDRERSGRIKRKRGDRILHASNREEEGEDSSSESANEEEDDEDDASVSVRLPAAVPLIPHNQHRKSFPMTAKAARPPAVWKVADEMIGVPVPRRARSSSAKRPHEFSISGGGGELIHRPVSPSSSSASVRKKMSQKPVSGTKHRPPKISKSSSVSEDLEIEVAEVLFGLTRQFQSPAKPEAQKVDLKGANGLSHESKSRVSSPVLISSQLEASQASALPPSNLSLNTPSESSVAPKRKRPRPTVKLDDEYSVHPAGSPSLPSMSASSVAKTEQELPSKTEAFPPRSEKKTVSTAVENDSAEQNLCVSSVLTAPICVKQNSALPENSPAQDFRLSSGDSGGQDPTKPMEEVGSSAKECPWADLDVNLDRTHATYSAHADKIPGDVNFSIDLMAPPAKSSPERECLSEHVPDNKSQSPFSEIEMVAGVDIAKKEVVMVERMAKQEGGEVISDAKKVESSLPVFDMKKHIEKDRTLDLQLDYDKQDKDCFASSKLQASKLQHKSAKIEPKPERAAESGSLPLQIPIGGWPGSFPPFGYMGQVPSLQPVVPMDGSSGSSKAVQPRLKRCVTHGYIANRIQCHQQLSRMNPVWPALAGAAPMYGGKPHNLNAVSSSESSILGNPLQGSFPARTLGAMQDKGGPLVAAFTGHSKDKTSAGNTFMEPSQRKPLVPQQLLQPGSTTNILHNPAFIFPLNQQQVAAAAPAARSGAPRSNPGAGNAAAQSSSSASSAVVGSGTGGRAATMSFNYPGLPPNEAQYMAILQNGAYPFPIPAHVGATPPYRGNSAQAMPFFNGSFYSSQMFHPSQLQQQQQQQPPRQPPSPSHPQKGAQQNTSTSSGSSSSHKPRQQSQRAAGGGAAVTKGSSYNLPASKQQQHLLTQCETGSEDNPSTPSIRAPQTQKSNYSHNLAMPIHPQNFTMVSPKVEVLGSGSGSRNEKQQPPLQHQSMKIELATSQAFAMSFASFGGAVAAAAAPLQGMDFTTVAHNPVLFQSLPEAARHGYQITKAAAGAAQATQYKKPHHQVSDDAKSAGDSMNTSVTGEESKMMPTGKSTASASHQSLAFSRPDKDTPNSSNHGNSTIENVSRPLNLIQTPANGERVSTRPASAAPTNSSSVPSPGPAPNSLLQQQQQQQQQQRQNFPQYHPYQLIQQQQQQQFQHQHQLKTSISTSNATMYSDRLSAGSTMTNFPQALAGFPQALVQGSSAANQSPQWKTCNRTATPAPAASSAPSSSSKNQHSQQQGRSMQQPILTPGHQTQISFGANVNSSKVAAATGQQHLAGGSSNPSLSPAASVAGSPQLSASKNTGGSPRSSSSSKAGPSQAGMSPLQQQQQSVKKSASSSAAMKSSPLSNSSAPSVLGQSHVAPAPNAGSKQQQQPQLLQQKQQPFSQAQFFFSNAYMPALTSQSNGAASAGYYHQRRQPEQPPQQQAQQNPATSDPAKAAAAASNMKGTASNGQLQHPIQFTMTQSASGVPHPLMSAAAAFPYMHSMPSVSAKHAEQKPAAGNDNLRACWQPEKK